MVGFAVGVADRGTVVGVVAVATAPDSELATDDDGEREGNDSGEDKPEGGRVANGAAQPATKPIASQGASTRIRFTTGEIVTDVRTLHDGGL